MGKRQRFPVKITVAGDEIEVDYEGSPPELPQGGLNCTFNFTEAKTFFALKCLLTPHIRASAGCYRALRVKAPTGTMLNCSDGASVGIRHLTGSYLVGNIFNAFAEAMPQGVQAFSGLPAIIHFYGRDEQGRTYSDHIYLGGGQGGSPKADGKSGMLWPTSASNGAVEVLETRAPVLVLEKSFLQDSGGAGRHRAGLGQQMRVRRALDDGGRTLVNSYPEGIGFTGHALFGGRPGMGSHTLMRDPAGAVTKDNGEGAVETLTSPDQIVEIRVGGGAGFGDPLERAIEAVQHDLDGGYVSRDAARDLYGVVAGADGTVDRAATGALRDALTKTRADAA
jgi:5-oxoprolinase (ATP-hydrolysing)/N-methylhydantoinase A